MLLEFFSGHFNHARHCVALMTEDVFNLLKKFQSPGAANSFQL